MGGGGVRWKNRQMKKEHEDPRKKPHTAKKRYISFAITSMYISAGNKVHEQSSFLYHI
jgi:hypothetical protein